MMAVSAPLLARLRFWAAVDALYAALLVALVLGFVPWKSPAANLTILTYALAVAASVLPLWQGRRWGWRLAVVTSVIGLVLALVVVTGFVSSWAFLRAIYGAFGKGASLVSLLLAATAFQVLGLHPALRLRALLGREARAHFTGGERLWRVLLTLAVVPFFAGAAIHARYSLSPLPPVPPEARALCLSLLRGALVEGHVDPARAAALSNLPVGPAPLSVTVFAGGQPVARTFGDGAHLGQAVIAAGRRLAADRAARAHAQDGRLIVERTTAVGPMPGWPRAFAALAFDPGRDTVRIAGGDVADTIATDELLSADVYGAAPLLPFLDEVRLGVDPDWLRLRLRTDDDTPLERLRRESWTECEDGACPLSRAMPVLTSRLDLREAARAAGEYMVRHQRPDGSFDYVYLPYIGITPPAAYNVSRHAGTAYSLAGLYGELRVPQFAGAAAQALGWLRNQLIDPCGGSREFACIAEQGHARLGPNALATLAMLAYAQHTGSHEGDEILRRLLAFILHMQKPNGDFHHLFAPTVDAIATHSPAAMFASEEAAYALIMAARLFDDEDYLRAGERALDFLTGEKYDHFLGRFTFGVDSWTCMAANHAWPALKHARYLEFCLGYADFLRRLQFRPGEPDSEDFVGHYGFSHVLVPQAPAAAGFSEALAAVAELARLHGHPARDVEQELTWALAALARDQLRPGNDFLVRDPAAAHGGIRRSLVQSEIRIDFVQHAASAFLHGARLRLDGGPG